MSEFFSIEPIKPSLFWSTRGKVIAVQPKEIKEVAQRGFIKLTLSEQKYYKMGDYNPVYDKGEKNQFNKILPKEIHDMLVSTVSPGDFLDLIEI